jgi:hypothetical protein
MQWKDYIVKVMKDYLAKNPEQKRFTRTRIIEGLRDLAADNEQDDGFAKMWQGLNRGGGVERIMHIRQVLEEMIEEGKLKRHVSEGSGCSYSLC